MAILGRAGISNAIVTLNQQGEPVDYFLGLGKPVGSLQESQPRNQEEIDYYLVPRKPAQPTQGDLSRQQAVDLAWQTFQEQFKALSPEGFEITQAQFFQVPEDGVSFWKVLVSATGLAENKPVHAIVLLSPGGRVFTTDAQAFLTSLDGARRMQTQRELEKTRGPFATWSLVQKQELYPEYHRLPPEDSISQQEAIRLAKEVLVTQEGVLQSQLDQWTICLSYNSEHAYVVEFHTPDSLLGQNQNYYQVFLSGQDGSLIMITDQDSNG